MHDVASVGCAHPLSDLESVFSGLANGNRTFAQALAQRSAFEQFFNDVGSGPLKPDVINRNNVGMIEGCRRASFLLEAAEKIRVVARGGPNQLQGDIPLKSFVACSKDLSHCPCADLLEHSVVPD